MAAETNNTVYVPRRIVINSTKQEKKKENEGRRVEIGGVHDEEHKQRLDDRFGSIDSLRSRFLSLSISFGNKDLFCQARSRALLLYGDARICIIEFHERRNSNGYRLFFKTGGVQLFP